MLPYFAEVYGNPSSLHSAGRRGGAAIAEARQTIADLLGARPG
jgi:cysteine desulfurase